MEVKEIFEQLIRYFPEGQETRLYANMRAYGEACLKTREFEEAEKYADLLLAQDKNATRRIAGCHIKLFAKLRCRNDKEFLHCDAFNKDMPEYAALLAECAENADKLLEYTKLASDNIATVAKDKEQERQRIAREAEAERQRLAKEAEAEEQRKLREEWLERRSFLQARREEQKRLQKEREEEIQKEKLHREKIYYKRRRLALIFAAMAVLSWIVVGAFNWKVGLIIGFMFVLVGLVLFCCF